MNKKPPAVSNYNTFCNNYCAICVTKQSPLRVS